MEKNIIKKLNAAEQIRLASNIFISVNQFNFSDSKGNQIENLIDNEKINNFYNEMNQVFIKKYNSSSKVENYLIENFQKQNLFKYIDIEKISFIYLDDICSEIFEY